MSGDLSQWLGGVSPLYEEKSTLTWLGTEEHGQGPVGENQALFKEADFSKLRPGHWQQAPPAFMDARLFTIDKCQGS